MLELYLAILLLSTRAKVIKAFLVNAAQKLLGHNLVCIQIGDIQWCGLASNRVNQSLESPKFAHISNMACYDSGGSHCPTHQVSDSTSTLTTFKIAIGTGSTTNTGPLLSISQLLGNSQKGLGLCG